MKIAAPFPMKSPREANQSKKDLPRDEKGLSIH